MDEDERDYVEAMTDRKLGKELRRAFALVGEEGSTLAVLNCQELHKEAERRLKVYAERLGIKVLRASILKPGE